MGEIIIVEPTWVGQSGLRYRVWYGGTVLIEATKVPAHDAARALLELGVTGRCEVWRQGQADADATFDIKLASKLTVAEGERRGLQVTRWNAFPMKRGVPKVAEDDAVATTLPGNGNASGYATQHIKNAA
jgi:hypothetical protein